MQRGYILSPYLLLSLFLHLSLPPFSPSHHLTTTISFAPSILCHPIPIPFFLHSSYLPFSLLFHFFLSTPLSVNVPLCLLPQSLLPSPPTKHPWHFSHSQLCTVGCSVGAVFQCCCQEQNHFWASVALLRCPVWLQSCQTLSGRCIFWACTVSSILPFGGWYPTEEGHLPHQSRREERGSSGHPLGWDMAS